MRHSNIDLEDSWKGRLSDEFGKPYMAELKVFLREQYLSRKKIYPKGNQYFSALNLTPYESVKVVILGQDPYHGPDQAHGLSFSVPIGIPPPPSLRNIYKELESDLGIEPADHGFLEHWAKQGVLLLNSVLTVEAQKPASHSNKGWELFTDRIIRELNEDGKPKAFVLWGSYAQKKADYLNDKNHLIIRSPHPSPLSAHRGFFGSKPFSQINLFLQQRGLEPISWRLPALQH